MVLHWSLVDHEPKRRHSLEKKAQNGAILTLELYFAFGTTTMNQKFESVQGEQENKAYSLNVMCLCIKLSRSQLF